MLYISPSGRNIVTQGSGGHSEITLFILCKEKKKVCKRTERAILQLRERFRSPPLSYFCRPLLSWESLLPCPQDPPASSDLLLLRLWLSPPCSTEITCLQMGPLAGRLGGWRAPWWIHQLALAPGLGEVERGRRCRELHDVPRVLF